MSAELMVLECPRCGAGLSGPPVEGLLTCSYCEAEIRVRERAEPKPSPAPFEVRRAPLAPAPRPPRPRVAPAKKPMFRARDPRSGLARALAVVLAVGQSAALLYLTHSMMVAVDGDPGWSRTELMLRSTGFFLWSALAGLLFITPAITGYRRPDEDEREWGWQRLSPVQRLQRYGASLFFAFPGVLVFSA